MNRLYIALLLLAFAACRKNEIQSSSGSLRIKKLTVGNKLSESYEYAGNKLVKELWYMGCETTPTMEFYYFYSGDRLQREESVNRSYYSSMSAMCDVNNGIRSTKNYVYDNIGRLTKVQRQNSSTEFIYDVQGRIVKSILLGGSTPFITTCEYDSRGNITKETESGGNVTNYEYDNHPNPYYKILPATSYLSAFRMSPNNIIKITGTNGTQPYTDNINYTYYSNDLPKTMNDNGTVYTFHYE